MKNIWNRIYGDYLMPDRLKEYENLLRMSIDSGYQHITLPTFYSLARSRPFSGKYFIHRHDIDTDPKTARKIFEIERKLGVLSSYYFRLSTLDIPLMQEIHQFGSEVGYHYEELATYCKRKRLKDIHSLRNRFEEIRELFIANYKHVESLCGFHIQTIAAHGDFVNRFLGIPNQDFIDSSVMKRLGILFECYDQRLITGYSSIISDTNYPLYYKPIHPISAIQDNEQVIFMLTHPRHWRTDPIGNSLDNLNRIWEGVKYRY